MNAEERQSLITNIAEMVAGMQVPYSIMGRQLGSAGTGWSKVFSALKLFGWQSEEEVKQALISALEERR